MPDRDSLVYPQPGDTYVSEAAPIIVGGVPRSGTTLLSVVLNSHPDLVCGPESDLFRDWRQLDRLEKPLPRFAWHVWRGWTDPHGRIARDFGVTVWWMRRLWRQSHSPASFIDRFFADYADRQGVSRWAEKTPGNLRAMPFIFHHFPRAKFVHVIRDGRDVCCSFLQWFQPHYQRVHVDARFAADLWRDWIADARQWRDHPNYTEVRYEALVGDPEPTLRSLLAFLEVRWDDAVLHHHERAHQNQPAVGTKQFAGAAQPIYTKALGRWQRDLSRGDRQTFERLAGDLLGTLGYAS